MDSHGSTPSTPSPARTGATSRPAGTDVTRRGQAEIPGFRSVEEQPDGTRIADHHSDRTPAVAPAGWSLPEIPHCTVERTDDGLMRITHNRTGDTETADTEERAVIAGVILRVSAGWPRRDPELPFRTGDRP
ncbi:hypothetical protein ACFXJ8_04365 [Nonomuraea sp. NPDC059194]|uniref:hypothetical protein n=1 Tax=Nonomuraea sp. NPDC059194 TaxID=3346764 RepID=UPI0036CAAE97